MLFGENLSGCHDTSLITIVEGYEHRHESHKSLAASHVALQQTVHLSSASHVSPYLPDDALLRPSEFEWKMIVEETVELFTDA